MKKAFLMICVIMYSMLAHSQFYDSDNSHIFMHTEISRLNDGSTTRLAYIFHFNGNRGHVQYTSESKITQLVKNSTYCDSWYDNLSYNLEFYEHYKGCYIYKCEKLPTTSGKWFFNTKYFLFSADMSKMLESGNNLLNLRKAIGRKYIEISCDELASPSVQEDNEVLEF